MGLAGVCFEVVILEDDQDLDERPAIEAATLRPNEDASASKQDGSSTVYSCLNSQESSLGVSQSRDILFIVTGFTCLFNPFTTRRQG